MFFIFLYQRWIYKTDPTRVNEFGFSAEMEQEAKAAKITNGATPPVPAIKSAQDKKQD